MNKFEYKPEFGFESGETVKLRSGYGDYYVYGGCYELVNITVGLDDEGPSIWQRIKNFFRRK
jgi:hypothetical protein